MRLVPMFFDPRAFCRGLRRSVKPPILAIAPRAADQCPKPDALASCQIKRHGLPDEVMAERTRRRLAHKRNARPERWVSRRPRRRGFAPIVSSPVIVPGDLPCVGLRKWGQVVEDASGRRS